MKRKVLLGALALCFSAFTAPTAEAQVELGDFDGDGLSDLSVALVDRNTGTTAWLTRLGENKTPLFWTWSVAGDALVTGRYYSEKRYFPGIVRVQDLNTPLQWHIKNPAGGETVVPFGLPGDHIPNQADLDCDGITDFAVARQGTGDLQNFYIWYTALSGSPGVVYANIFGMVGDKLAAIDVDGDGCAEQVALRPTTYEWFSKKLFEDKLEIVQWGLPGDKPLLPQDLNGDGKPDYIIVRPTPEGTQDAWIRYSGKTVTSGKVNFVGFSTAVPILGKFTSRRFFAWTERATGWTALRNPDNKDSVFPFTIPTNAIVRPDGTVLQPGDDGSFPAVTGGGPAAPAPGCDVNSDFRDGPNGALWKPVSESNGAPAILLPINYCGADLRVFGNNGTEVSGVARTKCGGNGHRAHFWLRVRASELAAHAPLTVKITRSGSTECRSVPDPRQRYD